MHLLGRKHDLPVDRKCLGLRLLQLDDDAFAVRSATPSTELVFSLFSRVSILKR